MILDQLGVRHSTDKSSISHNYCHFYERLFSPMRDTATKILELGVASGASLYMWRDYFPLAHVVGIDTNPETLVAEQKDNRVTVEIGNQGDDQFLRQVWERHGPFDLILDDASHESWHQMGSFKCFLPLMKKNSFYVIEDMIHFSVSDYISDMCREVVGDFNREQVPEYTKITSVSVYKGTVAIEF